MTSTKKKITLTLLAAFSLALVVWDIYVVVWGAADAQDSISRSLLQLFHKYPPLMLPLGIVLGHLCWPQKTPLTAQELYENALALMPEGDVKTLAEARGFVVHAPPAEPVVKN